MLLSAFDFSCVPCCVDFGKRKRGRTKNSSGAPCFLLLVVVVLYGFHVLCVYVTEDEYISSSFRRRRRRMTLEEGNRKVCEKVSPPPPADRAVRQLLWHSDNLACKKIIHGLFFAASVLSSCSGFFYANKKKELKKATLLIRQKPVSVTPAISCGKQIFLCLENRILLSALLLGHSLKSAARFLLQPHFDRIN